MDWFAFWLALALVGSAVASCFVPGAINATRTRNAYPAKHRRPE